MLTSGEVWDPSSVDNIPEEIKPEKRVHLSAPSSITLMIMGVSYHQSTPNFPTIIHQKQLPTHDEEGKTSGTFFAPSFAPGVSKSSSEVTKAHGITCGLQLFHDVLEHPVGHQVVEGDNQEEGVVVGDSVSDKIMKHDFAEPERDKPRWN